MLRSTNPEVIYIFLGVMVFIAPKYFLEKKKNFHLKQMKVLSDSLFKELKTEK